MHIRTPKGEVIGYLRRVDSRLAAILEKIDFDEWFEDHTGEESMFSDLCRTIIGQQLAGKAANAIYKRFSDFLNGEVNQKAVLSFKDADFRSLGLSWAKARSVLDLASKIKMNEVNLGLLAKMNDDEVITELTKVKGIGKWTAEMFLMFRMGRENIFSLGDLGLRNGLKKYLGKSDLSEHEIVHVVGKWSPYKSYGSIAMWHLLDNR